MISCEQCPDSGASFKHGNDFNKSDLSWKPCLRLRIVCFDSEAFGQPGMDPTQARTREDFFSHLRIPAAPCSPSATRSTAWPRGCIVGRRLQFALVLSWAGPCFMVMALRAPRTALGERGTARSMRLFEPAPFGTASSAVPSQDSSVSDVAALEAGTHGFQVSAYGALPQAIIVCAVGAPARLLQGLSLQTQNPQS